MVLVFGGTTEGKKVAELFDIIGQDYFYSTKTNAHKSVKGKRIFGAMDMCRMKTFCKENQVRVVVNAAHPFAIQLHRNIFEVASILGIVVLRYERKFSEIKETEQIKCFSSFDRLVTALMASQYKNILALTGMQTIERLKPVWEERKCFFRILNTKLSNKAARNTGISAELLIPMHPNSNVTELISISEKTEAQVLLTKESGESGFFNTKVQVSKQLNIPLWVVKRPQLPHFINVVDNEKDFLKLFYRIKKSTLKIEGELRSGYTTGSCVTAAAKACFLALVENRFPDWVEIEFPDGEKTKFSIFPKELSKKQASCVVIKDAGDDPDITHAKEIGCGLAFSENEGIQFLHGKGIGRVTLPGLQVGVGEPAINPVPRKMISGVLTRLSNTYELDCGFEVKPFVPEGKELAIQTFNSKVGVIGGISIIGTSGKVMPYSNEAFVESIKQQIRVVAKNGSAKIVLTSGKRSENRMRSYFKDLPSVAFVHFGNLVGRTIEMSVEQGIKNISVAIMLGKGVKLAEGHLDTHSKNVVFNAGFLARLVNECGYPESMVKQVKELKMANAVLDFIPFSASEPLYRKIVEKCYEECSALLSIDVKLQLFLLVADQGIIEHCVV